MSERRSTIAPVAVVAIALATGGWLLQQGVGRAANVYIRVRVLQEVVDRVESSFVDEVDRSSLYGSAIDGLVRDLDDPHSSFLEAADYENLRIRTEGNYGGVGLEVIERNGWVTVVSPIPGTPGARVGIRAGDQFYEIGGVRADTISTDQAVELLRGRPGTSVDVRMLRPGIEEPIPFTLERAEIQLKAVPFGLVLDGDVGYVPLRTVQETSSSEIRSTVDSLRDEGVRALVLDLRGNPGGLLNEGIAVADLFLAEGLAIVETRGRASGQTATYSASRGDRYSGMPVAVLVDGSSASASEIIAGALQDHDRAVVIGETTYGKGSVQSLYPLSGGNVLRLTTARWYTPVGRSIDRPVNGPDSREVRFRLSISGRPVFESSAEGRPEFQSSSGRIVYGGGGITPDVLVAPETLTQSEARAVRRLFARGGAFNVALFNFAVRYVSEHPDLEPGFRTSDAVLDALYAALPEWEAEGARDDYAAARGYVRHHLEREIALHAWGEVGEFEQSRRYDTQLERSLQLLAGVETPQELLTAVARAAPGELPGG